MPIQAQRLTLPGSSVTLAADRWDPPEAAGRPVGTVLLLHGGGQTRHSWQRTGSILAGHGWRALAVDARGHGDSDWAPDGDYGQDALVADLRGVIAHLGVRPVLIGASMGGMAALIAQGEHPDLARALALVDITPRVEEEGAEKITAFMRAGLRGFDSVEDALTAVVAYNPHRTRPPRPEGLLRNLRFREGRYYWHWDPRLVDQGDEPTRTPRGSSQMYERARAAAASIRVPTLLVRGAQSNVVSTEGARELLQLIPTATAVDVAGAGHMVAGDDNDVFTDSLLAFLKAVNDETDPDITFETK